MSQSLSQHQAKPRLTYQQFLASQQQPRVTTLASLIERFIAEMDGTGGQEPVKPLGDSHRCTLRVIARMPIGAKPPAAITKHDVIELAKQVQANGCKPATNMQYITYLSGVLKYAGSAWDEHAAVSVAPVEMAKPFLQKNNYIGKSEPRSRRPTPEEIERLVAHFRAMKARYPRRTKIDMALITLWQVKSARRIGESCALLWEDWNRQDHTILVRKMKDPRRRDKSKVVALPKAAQAMLEELWPLRDPNEPRIFPWKKTSCVKRYIMAKQQTGIDGLRLHDSRRDCGTRLVEDEGYAPAQAILVTGHETVTIFERTYLCQDPAKFKLGPRAASA